MKEWHRICLQLKSIPSFSCEMQAQQTHLAAIITHKDKT